MDLFALSARLTLDSSEYERGLSQAENRSGMFASILKANLITKGVEVCVKGLARLGGAAANVFKGAIDSYADYEQLVGGVETLFEGSADTVMKNAEKAYQTAGMSANEYMDTVTSFSASLIQSLGGDTRKAADMADLAIRDMSDNSNKMGSDMQSIQNAYSGFAKSNYTMLDNLNNIGALAA